VTGQKTAAAGCKACSDEYTVTKAQMERLLKTTLFAPERRVSEQQYAKRLALCQACPKWQERSQTCLACGCIIPVIAWLKERGCPLPGGGKWQPLG